MAPSRPSDRPADDSPLIRAFFEKRENLLLFLAARTRSMATAEDLVQDLYLKIATLGPGTDVRAPVALLYRMASNVMIDHVAATSGRRGGARSGGSTPTPPWAARKSWANRPPTRW